MKLLCWHCACNTKATLKTIKYGVYRMKIKFNETVIEEINAKYVYKHTEEDGVDFLERIEVTRPPNDHNVYLIPAELINHNGEKKNVLAFYKPEFAFVTSPLYMTDPAGKLIDVRESGFIDESKGFDYYPLMEMEPFNGEVIDDSVEDVAWQKFQPSNITYDVGYVFLMKDLHYKDEVAELGKYAIVIPGEEGNSDHPGTIVPEFILRKIPIDHIPTTGKFWYLPVDITFNSKQRRNGYVLYDVTDQCICDIHIFHKQYGLVSTVLDDDELENCGIFKDNEAFSVELLLTGIITKANDNIQS
jgi:hypothetical protein